MAIETTYFKEYDPQGVCEWFKQNATDYFDRIEISEDKMSVIGYIGEIPALEIKFIKSNDYCRYVRFYITNLSGTKVTVGPTSPYGESGRISDIRLDRAAKTDCGIAFSTVGNYVHGSGSGGASQYKPRSYAFFITKDSEGNTSFVYFSQLNYDRTNCPAYPMYQSDEYLYVTNLLETTFQTIFSGKSSANGYYAKEFNDYTQLAPIPLKKQGLTNLPNCFVAPFCDATGFVDYELDAGGTKYLFNGYIALKD